MSPSTLENTNRTQLFPSLNSRLTQAGQAMIIVSIKSYIQSYYTTTQSIQINQHLPHQLSQPTHLGILVKDLHRDG